MLQKFQTNHSSTFSLKILSIVYFIQTFSTNQYIGSLSGMKIFCIRMFNYVLTFILFNYPKAYPLVLLFRTHFLFIQRKNKNKHAQKMYKYSLRIILKKKINENVRREVVNGTEMSRREMVLTGRLRAKRVTGATAELRLAAVTLLRLYIWPQWGPYLTLP